MGFIIKKQIKTDTGEVIPTDVYGRIIPELSESGVIIYNKTDWYRNKTDYTAGDKPIKNGLKNSYKFVYNRVDDGVDILEVSFIKTKGMILVDNPGWTTDDIIIEELPIVRKNGK